MNVLSLFDGISCGQIALNKIGINIDSYFASEIHKQSIKITQANYPGTIQLGDVSAINPAILPKIDLLIGGSPCQSFSFIGKRNGMTTNDKIEVLTLEHYLELKENNYQFEGQSYLFWEYIRLLKELKPKYFLLENVAMVDKWQIIISRTLGVNPITINSNLVSGQNRIRNYWTNIGMKPSGLFGYPISIIEQPKDKEIYLKDVLQSNVSDKYLLSDKMLKGFKKRTQRDYGFQFKLKNENDKASTITTKAGQRATDNFISQNGKIRRLTPIECERLQTLPDNYTNYVADSYRFFALGNCFTIDVITHILKYMQC